MPISHPTTRQEALQKRPNQSIYLFPYNTTQKSLSKVLWGNMSPTTPMIETQGVHRYCVLCLVRRPFEMHSSVRAYDQMFLQWRASIPYVLSQTYSVQEKEAPMHLKSIQNYDTPERFFGSTKCLDHRLQAKHDTLGEKGCEKQSFPTFL